MKTVRDIVTALACDGATVVSILGALPTHILDYLVIEPSGVVLAVDREKLRDALVRAWIVAAHTETTIEEYERDGLTPEGVAAVDAGVDAILTSMAEQGWREVEHGGVGRLQLSPGARHKDGRPMEGAWVVHWDAQGPLPMHLDCGIAGENCEGREVAVLKPLPPAKENV